MSIYARTFDGRTEHGIWSDAAGGFIDSGIYTLDQAASAVTLFLVQGEDRDDLSALPFCSEHRDEEMPANACELCEEDEEDEED